MAEVTQVRLSGLGGQGIVLAGVLLGQAGVLDGKYISASNSYGAQARGSACKSEIVFAAEPIDFPHLLSADILVAMSQAAYDLYCPGMAADGLILYDEGPALPRKDAPARQVGIPATQASIQKFKDAQMANLILVGALVEISQIVSPASIRKAVRMHVNKRFQGAALRAMNLGMELGSRSHV